MIWYVISIRCWISIWLCVFWWAFYSLLLVYSSVSKYRLFGQCGFRGSGIPIPSWKHVIIFIECQMHLFQSWANGYSLNTRKLSFHNLSRVGWVSKLARTRVHSVLINGHLGGPLGHLGTTNPELALSYCHHGDYNSVHHTHWVLDRCDG